MNTTNIKAVPDEVFSPFIESELLSLLPLKKSNSNLYLKWKNDAEIRKFQVNEIPWMLEEQDKIMEPIMKPYRRFVLFEIWHNIDKRPIGTVGFHNIRYISRKAEISILIGEKNYWGKRIETIALNLVIKYGFEELNLYKIYAHVSEPNTASYKILEKLGMNKESILKKEKYIDGKYVDLFQYAIFQDEYFKKKVEKTGGDE